MRDTVYNGLLKRARATMHAEFVSWADQVNAESDRGQEFEAILGYHLEQAYRYLGELGPIDEAGARSGAMARAAWRRRRGAPLLAATACGGQPLSARCSAARYGRPAARRLLPELGETLMGLGDFAGARSVVEEARVAADRRRISGLWRQASSLGIFSRLYSGELIDSSEVVLKTAQELIPMLEQRMPTANLQWRGDWSSLFSCESGSIQPGKHGRGAVDCAREAGRERPPDREDRRLSVELALMDRPR